MVPLTLVLRLLASAELRPYQASLPCLITAGTIWTEWTWSRWSPLAWNRVSLERIVVSRNLPVISPLLSWHYHFNYVTWLVLHWGGWYEATKLLGGSMVFQEATSEPAGKAKKLTAWHLMPQKKYPGKQGCNCQFHNHKIFNPQRHRTVNTHPSVLSCSVH